MRKIITISKFVLFVCVAFCSIAFDAARGGECTIAPRGGAYRIFYHNSGLYPLCIQDFDMDIPEYRAFLSDFSQFIVPTGHAVIGDNFLVHCEDPTPYVHAEIVEDYLGWSYGSNVALHEEASGVSWVQLVNNIANNPAYHRSVGNLSNGDTEWHQDATDAVMNAYNHEILLVGSPLTFASGPTSIKDKVLTCFPMNATGQYCAAHVPQTNVAEVGVPTNWFRTSENQHYLATAGNSPDWTDGYPQEGLSGSFSTALLSGTVQRIADFVASQGVPEGQFVSAVLDYVISACDRNVDPLTYHHVSGPSYPTSFGPWSSTWGYGIVNPWKALIYAYGWGKLQPKDSALNPGQVTNPHVIFSDHFRLRGDLFVPAGETFEVSPLAGVYVNDDWTPEGPANLGLISELCEIHVAGAMEVQTHLINGVNASVTVDAGGLCTVKSGGLITIGYGQVLHVYEEGELTLETGGEIRIGWGGQLIIDGEFSNFGAVTLEPGSQMICSPNSQIFLATDLNIPAFTVFSASSNTIITAALTDARGTGSDPNRVEIICEGVMNLAGSAQYPVLFKAQISGAGKWAGISFVGSDEENGSTWSYVRISDANVGIVINSGFNPLDISCFYITACTTAMKVTNRSAITLSGGEVWACTTGIHCESASPTLTGIVIHNNNVGIKCSTGSSPKVRWCSMYGNTNGVATMNSASLPNLGTNADPGNNSFPKTPANTLNISAFDPASNIYAQKNWWGTTVLSQIQAKIVVIDAPPQGCGSVIFQPFLTAPPVPPEEVSQRPDLDTSPTTPPSTYLEQNYPNPFNPVTTIRFGLNEPSSIALRIYDVSGRLVRTLVADHLQAGIYERVWDGKDSGGRAVASGIYLYKLETKSVTETKKMILLR